MTAKLFKPVNKIIVLVLSCFLAQVVNAQTPLLINYQGVALNTNGTPIANQSINLRFTVLDDSPTGIEQYTEERVVTTDATGLFDCQIGSIGATNINGSMSSIFWQVNKKFLKVEMDPLGGSNFTDMGTQQMISVPYALHSKQTESLAPNVTLPLNKLSNLGASTNQVLQYNGIQWAPATINFTLPYSGSDATINSFNIQNTHNLGRTISGLASGTSGVGIYGEAINSGKGVCGVGYSTSGYGVFGQNTLGIAVNGVSSPNSASIPAIKGECTGSTGMGVAGYSDGTTGIGVYGESMSGTAVKGYGSNVGSVALFGSSLAGTGVKAYSFTGKALEVDGNVKISGGNTNPSAGAVLTSDASGNATWKNNKVAFSASDVINTSIPNLTSVKLEYDVEHFDLQNNFQVYNGAVTSSSSKFTAPIAGIYDISASVNLAYSSTINNITIGKIVLVKNGVTYAISSGTPKNGFAYSQVQLYIARKMHLNANDVIWIEVFQDNGGSVPITTDNPNISSHFDGALLIAD